MLFMNDWRASISNANFKGLSIITSKCKYLSSLLNSSHMKKTLMSMISMRDKSQSSLNVESGLITKSSG